MKERLVFMWQGPGRYFAYWEMSEATRSLIAEYLQTSWENLTLFIQIMDNGSLIQEISVDRLANNWYFDCLGQEELQIYLGVKDYWNTFIPLLESNRIILRKPLDLSKIDNKLRKPFRGSLATKENDHEYIGVYSSFSIHKS